MDKTLTFEIVKYIFNCFGVGVKLSKYDNLFSDKFKTNLFLSFDEDGKEIKKDIYSCQIKKDDTNITHLACDVSFEEYEYILLTCFNNISFIGCLLNTSDKGKTKILYSSNGALWNEMSILAQANYLAGLEQVKISNLEYTMSELDENIDALSIIKNFYSECQQEISSSFDDIELSESIIK